MVTMAKYVLTKKKQLVTRRKIKKKSDLSNRRMWRFAIPVILVWNLVKSSQFEFTKPAKLAMVITVKIKTVTVCDIWKKFR
jgi:hypothetical protein